MKILFLSSNLIGDSILSTGILGYIIKKNKNSKVTVITGLKASQIFNNFPQVEEVIKIKKRKFNLHWVDLWLKIFKYKWDLVIDLRSSLLSYLLYAKKRKIFKKNYRPISQVEKLSNFMGSKNVLRPKLWTNTKDKIFAKSIINNKIVIAIAPGGNWKPKIWPSQNYNLLICHLLKQYKTNRLKFLIIGSKDEKFYFDKLSVNVQKGSLIDFIGENLNITYACLELCKLFIGNDSGLMHLAAAAGIPTIGLFGPTRDDWYKPYGEKCYVIRTKESYNDLKHNKKSNINLMESIDVTKVSKLIQDENLILK